MTKDGSIIKAKVSAVGTAEIKYKKWENQNGPSYALAISDILAITYQNGEREVFDEPINTGNRLSPQQGQMTAGVNHVSSNYPNIDLSQFHGLLIARGNCVYVAANTTEDWDLWGVERIKTQLKQLGLWTVVDRPEQAHFILQFGLCLEGADQAFFYLRTRKSYENFPKNVYDRRNHRVQEPESGIFVVHRPVGEEKRKVVDCVDAVFDTKNKKSPINNWLRSIDNPNTDWTRTFWWIP